MDVFVEGLTEEWLRLVRLAPRLVAALLLFVFSVWLGRLLGRGVVRLLERGRFTPTHKVFFRKLTMWLGGFVGIVLGLNVLGLEGAATGLLAGGGVTAVVLGFAFRGIGENLLAGFFLAFSRPFEMGDLIQSREFQGVVRGIELRYTHIRTGDGRDVYVPSAQIFNEPLVNFTKDGLRRVAFVVGIDYGDDSAAARAALLDALRGVPGLLAEPAPRATISALAAQYVELEVSFWLDVFKPGVDLVRLRTEAMEGCRRALREGGFTVSSDVTSVVSVDGGRPLAVRVTPADPLPGGAG